MLSVYVNVIIQLGILQMCAPVKHFGSKTVCYVIKMILT